MEKDNWKESSAAMFSSMQEAKDCYYQRLNYELDMIEQMGFTHYFLIVADFVKWSRDQKSALQHEDQVVDRWLRGHYLSLLLIQ